MRKVLVTGGAGFIGSHTVDLLLEKGYKVRVLDNLEYPTHKHGKPAYLSKKAEFIRGDVRNIDDMSRALRGVDGVIHLAATGGFTSDIVKYIDCNSVGTANLLELIQQQKYHVKRIVVASSVGIYGEGLYQCKKCGPINGVPRELKQMEAQRWELTCPVCGEIMESLPTNEKKIPSPEKPYSVSKFDEERLVLGFGRDYDIHTCALRYFLTYGPRQSLTNPYTGVISIFASRILNGLSPIIYEDGNQTRDFVYVSDVAGANVLAFESDKARGKVFNVGTGMRSKIRDIALLLSELLGKPDIAPEFSGEYRPGESRHIYADISKIREIGYEPSVSLHEGLKLYFSWINNVGEVHEYLSAALAGLKSSAVVRGPQKIKEKEPREDSLSVIVPAYNEAGNLESIVRYIVSELESFINDFEVLIVNDGSQDGTGIIADHLAEEDQRIRVIHHPFNVGYGGAQKSGFKHAAKEWAVLVPADHQFDARDLEKFLNARNGVDIIGSFRVERQDPWLRCFISSIYNWYMKMFYRVPLNDLNWIKMFRRKIFDQIEIETHGFAVDAEIVVKAMSMGYRIKQIPIIHYNRTWGNPTGVNFKNLYRTALELLHIRGMLKRLKQGRRIAECSGKS